MSTLTRWSTLPMHAARALWWAGVPVVLVGSFLLGDPTLMPPFVLLRDASASVWPVSPLAAELLGRYPVTIVATVVAVALTAWSHSRKSGAVRPPTLLLPTYVAALEACHSAYWAASCPGLGGETIADNHALLHQAALATFLATAGPLVIAAVVVRLAPNGVAGTMTKMHWLSAFAATASVLLIWLAYDVVFFRPVLGPGR